jgi:hypothetical protein
MLTETACRNAQCPADKTRVPIRRRWAGPRGHAERREALVLEAPYRGKEKRLAIGNDSEAGPKAIVVGLKAAREASNEARRVLKNGTEAVRRRKADTAAKIVSSATTFKAVAVEYHAVKAKSGGWSATYAAQSAGRNARRAAHQSLTNP